MQSFVSTRGASACSLRDAVLRGLAPDGGLYVPREIATLSGSPPRSGDFAEVASWAAAALFPDLPGRVLDEVVADSFSFPIPLVEVEPAKHVLELFGGPTCSFKDVGARVLARLAERLVDVAGPVTILVATSGDTGGAVAHAFHGLERFRVVVLFPRDRVSARQRRQMTTLGGNVTALAVDGDFDDCQRIVKEAFLDRRLAERHGLTSANSINVGRFLPQALYYVYAASLVGWRRSPARFVVPCGNLGNLCAGLLAHRMGMPASGFLAATNANRALVDFLELGETRVRQPVRTDSSAMDVADPSNLERLMWLYAGDLEAVRREVEAVSVADGPARDRARALHAATGYLLDPHTAVAYEALHSHDVTSAEPSIVLATAHPAKFPEFARAITGGDVALPEGLARTLSGSESMTDVPATLEALRAVLDESTA